MNLLAALQVFEHIDDIMHAAGIFVIGDVAQQKLSNGPVNCRFHIDESGLLSMSATQETTHSQVPFARAKFSLPLAGSRGTIHESICIVQRDGRVVRLIDASTRAVALPADGRDTFLPHADSEREMEFKVSAKG